MKFIKSLLGISLLLSLFLACQHSSHPELSIPTPKASDSIVLAYLQGDSASRTDTLLIEGQSLSIYPDTSLYREVFISYGKGEQVAYYRLIRGQWQKAIPQLPKDSVRQYFPDIYIPNIDRKYQSIWGDKPRRKAAVLFADLANAMPTKDSIKSLEQRYGRDSLNLVFMYLAPSDSMVRRLMKRDTLKGLAFSDTLGEVSRLRRDLGIDRSPKIHIFVVDSANRIILR